jgi:hypothetical protein
MMVTKQRKEIGESTNTYVLLMGAQHLLEVEECVLSMGQRRDKGNYAALKVARLKLEMEDCARSILMQQYRPS